LHWHIHINLFITFSTCLHENNELFNTSCRILNFTAAVTLVLINKYTVSIATNRLGRNIKTNKKRPMSENSLCWLGTETSIKDDWDTLVVWDRINCVMHVIMITHWSTRRKSPTWRKSPTNFYQIILFEYTSPVQTICNLVI
jgi:hypothetical protein